MLIKFVSSPKVARNIRGRPDQILDLIQETQSLRYNLCDARNEIRNLTKEQNKVKVKLQYQISKLKIRLKDTESRNEQLEKEVHLRDIALERLIELLENSRASV